MIAPPAYMKREQSHVFNSQRWIKSAKMGLQREREGMRVLMCVLMWGKKPDKEHADPQSWLQSSPDESVLRHTVMYPWAGSAEAATRTKAEPPDKSDYQQTKGDLLMHDMGLETNAFVLHSMPCIILCESESRSWTLIFCRMCLRRHVCRHVRSLRNINVFLTASATVSSKSSFCAPVFLTTSLLSVQYSNTLTLCWCWWVKARGGDEQCRGKMVLRQTSKGIRNMCRRGYVHKADTHTGTLTCCHQTTKHINPN